MKWLQGPYEAGSDKPAIELLVGNADLLKYLNGIDNEKSVLRKMNDHEKKWIDLAQSFLLYDEPLFQIS
jgi:hypothetical protein